MNFSQTVCTALDLSRLTFLDALASHCSPIVQLGRKGFNVDHFVDFLKDDDSYILVSMTLMILNYLMFLSHFVR